MLRWQKRVIHIESWCGTDHAGCIRTRKSVSGCALMLGKQYGLHMLQRTSRDRSQPWRNGVLWVGECDIANVWPSEYSPGLGMEIPRPRVDGCHSGNCDWKPTRARMSEAHRHSVSLGANDGHRRQDLAWQEAHQGDACRIFFKETCRCRNDAELRGWIGIEVPIR